jgi:hypothetical protein
MLWVVEVKIDGEWQVYTVEFSRKDARDMARNIERRSYYEKARIRKYVRVD